MPMKCFLTVLFLLLSWMTPEFIAISRGEDEPPLSHRKGEAMRVKSLYLELFRNSILNIHYMNWDSNDGSGWPTMSENGPSNAVSMAGKRRIDNFANIVAQVIHDKIPGHVIETGCWRGGASFMAAKVIELLGENKERKVYMADSFSGIPKVEKRTRFNIDMSAHSISILKDNSVERVRNDSIKFGIAQGVRFVVGFFNVTLPALIRDEPNLRLSVLRMDGDTYDASKLALETLYDRVSPGGYIIVDDYSDWRSCMSAVDEFRSKRGIKQPLVLIPHMPGEQNRGVYWRKPVGVADANECICLGDGKHSLKTSPKNSITHSLVQQYNKDPGPNKERGGGGSSSVSLRVHDSYSPNKCVPMPANGPPGAVAFADVAVWGSVISVISLAIAAHLEFQGTNSKIGRYSFTVHALQELIVWWQTLPQIDRSVVSNIDRLVLSCEELLQREQQAWRSTSQTVRMLQKQSKVDSGSTEG